MVIDAPSSIDACAKTVICPYGLLSCIRVREEEEEEEEIRLKISDDDVAAYW